MIRVLLVDDQALVRGGFHSILDGQEDIEVVGEAADGAEGIDLALATSPDVILMDVRMPGTDGIEATRRLRETGSRARVLVLTTFDLDEYVYAALRAGASGFLLKDAPREQLLAAIRQVTSGDALLAPSVTRRLIERFVGPASDPSLSARFDELSERGTSMALTSNRCLLSASRVAPVRRRCR